jgi:preprotein translocase subunit SecG
MFVFLIVIITLIAGIMIFLVLIQSGKGGGLAGIAAGGATTQILGARQAPDILEKATWTLAALFIALCILSNFVIDRGQQQRSIIQQQSQQQQTPQPLAPLPQDAQGTPGAGTQEAQPTQPAPAPSEDQN